MRTFRVSHLEAFRRYHTDEESSHEDMIAMLRGEFAPNEKMQAGTALHAILQTIDADGLPGGEFVRLSSPDGVYTFQFECDIPLTLEPFREIAGSRIYRIGGEEIELTGHADTLGATIEDHKLCKQFDAEMYHDSIQWRAYLAIFGKNRFRYNGFVYREPTVDRPNYYVIRDFQQVTFPRYPEMDEDVRAELARLADFATQHEKELQS